jgi:hypothetical protein
MASENYVELYIISIGQTLAKAFYRYLHMHHITYLLIHKGESYLENYGDNHPYETITKITVGGFK